MFNEAPNNSSRGERAPTIIGSVFKEMLYSAGVVVGGALISAILVSVEGKTLR